MFKNNFKIFWKYGGMSCPLLIGINSIYVTLRLHVDNISFIVTAPLFYTDVVMYE